MSPRCQPQLRVSQLLFPLLILFDLDTEVKIDAVLVPNTEDSATPDNGLKSGSTVTESVSEEEDIAGILGICEAAASI